MIPLHSAMPPSGSLPPLEDGLLIQTISSPSNMALLKMAHNFSPNCQGDQPHSHSIIDPETLRSYHQRFSQGLRLHVLEDLRGYVSNGDRKVMGLLWSRSTAAMPDEMLADFVRHAEQKCDRHSA
jgi:hypothetical protein